MVVPYADAVERLVGVMQELSLARDLSTVTTIVRTAARQLTGADGATFVLRDRDRCYYVDEDAIAPLWKGQRFPIEACVSGWSMLHRETVAIPDIYTDTRVPVDAYRPTFVKSLVITPIRSVEPVGAIGTYWAAPHCPDDNELKLLATLANSTSIALENIQIHDELERRVQERTAALVRVQRQKEELAALIVHDLRSPANGIMLASKVRLRSKDALASDRQHWQNVYTSAESIHRMAMNLLDVMRSEDGTFAARISAVALPKLLADVADQMTPLAAAQSVWLAVDAVGAPATAACDEELVRRVLQNLIDNALRYSPEDATVRLIARADGDHLELRVVDQGPGIPEDARASVFEKWSRLARAEDQAVVGRGLGLAFCRLAVQAHGGTIGIESNVPRGTVFVVRLPAAHAGS